MKKKAVTAFKKLPAGDTLLSLNFSDTSQNDTISVSCNEKLDQIEELPRRPYISSIGKTLPTSKCKKIIAPSIKIYKDQEKGEDDTETTDLSRGINMLKNSKEICHRRNATIAVQSTKLVKNPSLYKSIKENFDNIFSIDESNLLKEYWKEKDSIETKYKNMIAEFFKEETVEIRLKISTTKKQDRGLTQNIIDEIRKINEYYNDAKTLINKQKIMEEEELVKKVQLKLKHNSPH